MKTDKEINELIKQGLEKYAKADTKPAPSNVFSSLPSLSFFKKRNADRIRTT